MTASHSRYLLRLKNLTNDSPFLNNQELEELKATDAPQAYWLLDCRESGHEEKLIWKKLILQNARTIQPGLLSLDTVLLLYLGVDEAVFVLDLPTGELVAHYDLGTPFLWFQLSDDQIFAVCELEIYAFTLHGGLKWTTNFPDVLKQVEVKGERLEVTDLSGQKYHVDSLTGKMLLAV
jgi:hypothetical protein